MTIESKNNKSHARAILWWMIHFIQNTKTQQDKFGFELVNCWCWCCCRCRHCCVFACEQMEIAKNSTENKYRLAYQLTILAWTKHLNAIQIFKAIFNEIQWNMCTNTVENRTYKYTTRNYRELWLVVAVYQSPSMNDHF